MNNCGYHHLNIFLTTNTGQHRYWNQSILMEVSVQEVADCGIKGRLLILVTPKLQHYGSRRLHC